MKSTQSPREEEPGAAAAGWSTLAKAKMDEIKVQKLRISISLKLEQDSPAMLGRPGNVFSGRFIHHLLHFGAAAMSCGGSEALTREHIDGCKLTRKQTDGCKLTGGPK